MKVHETFLELLSDHRSQIDLKICYLHSFLRWNLNCSCVSSTAIEGENTVFTNQSWISMLLEINPKTTIELVFTTGDDQNKLWSAFCFRDLSKLADLQQWRLSLGSFWFHILNKLIQKLKKWINAASDKSWRDREALSHPSSENKAVKQKQEIRLTEQMTRPDRQTQFASCQILFPDIWEFQGGVAASARSLVLQSAPAGRWRRVHSCSFWSSCSHGVIPHKHL